MGRALHGLKRWVWRRNLPVLPRVAVKEAAVRARMLLPAETMRASFFLIGAMKAGTSSLFNNLVLHPEIAEPLTKEIRYFDFHYRLGERWYLAHFPLRARSLRRGETVTGEASPSYMFDPHAPGRMHRFDPDAKLVVMLRNPVARAHSHYQHAVRYWGETRAFGEAVRGEDEWMPGEQRLRRDHPAVMPVRRIQHSYLTRGRYLEQLTDWSQLFGREQMLVLKSEDYFHEPAAVLRDVLRFLALREWRPDGFERLNVARYAEIGPQLEAWLYDYYRPFNRALYEYLGRDLGWERERSA